MSIVGITNQTEAQAMKTLTNDRMMQKDDFLKMLTMQLRHQDPLNPMSNAEFAAQLATFSQLETLNNINDNVQTQILMSQSLNNSFMINMIGKDVKSYGNLLNFAGEEVNIHFHLMGNAETITARIFDESGREVAVVNSSQRATPGDRFIKWDGKTTAGAQAPLGNYTFTIEAKDRNGQLLSTESMNNGIVSGITYEGGMPFLIINGANVNLRDIISINSAL